MKKIEKSLTDPDAPQLECGENFYFPDECTSIRLTVEWISKQQGAIADLDLNIYCYDERARFIDRIDSTNKTSKDESCVLIKEVDTHDAVNSHIECIKIDFGLVDSSTSAILICLDGGPRIFQFLQSINVSCSKVLPTRAYGDFLPNEEANSGKKGPIFKMVGRPRKNYQGIVLCTLYKDGWNPTSTDSWRWVNKAFMEPLFATSAKDKLDTFHQMVIAAVPALEKFRPRLFNSIRDLCAALSSTSLPKLKKKFLKNEEGLHIGEFTDVLFRQLFSTHPKIIEDNEAPYTVAMLQEMFNQIDYNGDNVTSWDEFTSFCVHSGLAATVNQSEVTSTYSLEQYVIEYGEEFLQRDHVLSAYRFVALMRHVPEVRKLLVISEDSDNILVMDERFRVYSQIIPTKIQVMGGIPTSNNNRSESNDMKATKVIKAVIPKALVYDAIYLTGREMYCFTSSDHSITVCKEFSSMGGKKISYVLYNKFYHTLLHLKLCWSAKHEILCSTASDRIIYGWNIDTATILFQISRHSDIITDFVAVDHLDVFITCSMDKRIVMWSSTSRRVKGILLGHKRGVRCLSVYENTLLSAGFECEAKTWDLVNKESVAVLKGHRYPITAAKLMCDRAQSEKEYRAITVDEIGEFRLWNIYVREKSSEPVAVPTLQIFEMQHPESPLNQFRFLAVPFNPKFSTSYYSNLIACSTKLLHFLPEKNTKEFVPPTASVFNDAAASIMTAIGRNLLTYDVANGQLGNAFEDVAPHDISALCMDGTRGRRVYAGTSQGQIMLLNCMTGLVIDAVHTHIREVTGICERTSISRNCVYSCSLDGQLHMYEETNGKLHLHNSVEQAFDFGQGIAIMKSAPTVNVLVVASIGRSWGLFSDSTLKKLLIIHQPQVITALEIVGASRDKMDSVFKEEQRVNKTMSNSELVGLDKENLLTLAIASANGISIYSMDTLDMRGVKTFSLEFDSQMYINSMTILNSPDADAVNYSASALRDPEKFSGYGQHLVAATDDGGIIVWEIDKLRIQSDEKFRVRYNGVPLPSHSLWGLLESAGSNAGAPGGAGVLGKGHQVAPPSLGSARSSESESSRTFSHTKSTNSVGTTDTVSTMQKIVKLMSMDKNSTTSLDGSKSTQNLPKSPVIRKETLLTRQAARVTNSKDITKSWVEMNAKAMFPLPRGEKSSTVIPVTHQWSSHFDSVCCLFPMNAHGCFVTASHDGYQRCWNLDKQCLGELILPNITEAMKNNSLCKEPGTSWRFILERIPVTDHHRDLATVLTKNLKYIKGRSLEKQQTERRNFQVLQSGFKGIKQLGEEDVEQEDESTKNRRIILKSLNEPPVVAADHPPQRLPTREEKELIKLSLTMEHMETMQQNSKVDSSLVIGEQSTIFQDGTLQSPSNNQNSSFITSNTLESALNSPSGGLLGRKSSPSLTPLPRTKNASSTLRTGEPLKSADFFGGDNSVLMSAFGGPSLWSVPGERDIYGNAVLPVSASLAESVVPPAFSEASIKSLQRDGLIDNEAHRILRKLAANPDRVEVYDRSQPTLLVRNASMSTSVQLPALDAMRKTEISFGAQKDMYKNAEKALNDKNNISKAQVRNAVAMARIELNVRKVNSMVHLIEPPSHDEVILPKTLANPNASSEDLDEELQKLKNEDQRMKLRLLKSSALVPADAAMKARPLDRESIDRWMIKMNKATDYMSDGKLRDEKRKRKKEVISQARLAMLEKKLQLAIRGEYRARLVRNAKKQAFLDGTATPVIPNSRPESRANNSRPTSRGHFSGSVTGRSIKEENEAEEGDDTMSRDTSGPPSPVASIVASIAPPEPKKFQLTTRMLLPFYTLDSVTQFMDIFAKVDENFSGDLDVNEWIKLFTSLNESIPVLEARMIFMKIDKDSDGYLTMRELIPVVFNKASKDQQKLIIQFTEMELTKKIESESIPKVTVVDLEFLFEAYDTENFGFVEVSLIKERIRNMYLSEQALFSFMETIAELADDEMVNISEFKRIFKIYTGK